MGNLIVNIIGAVLAILFVGYFAVDVGAIPLLVIVACCLGLMIYALYQETRNGRGVG